MARTTVSHRRLLALAAPHEKLLANQITREFGRYGRRLLRIVRGPVDATAGGMRANALRNEHSQRMREIIGRNVARVSADFAKATLRDLGVRPTSRRGAAIVATIKSRSELLAGDVVAQIAGRTNDWTVGGLALWATRDQQGAIRYLRERWVGAMASRRAAKIAGNTIHQAASIAQQATAETVAQQEGQPLYRKWMTRRDSKVRDTHRAMHGIVAAADEVFMVPRESGGHDEMRFPRDPRGSIENVVNCRCYLKYTKRKPKSRSMG